MIVLILALVVLVGLGLAGWWLDGWLVHHALVVASQGQWQVVDGTQGWALIAQLWPIALGFVVVAFAIGGGLGLWLSQAAHRADVSRLKARTEQAEREHRSAFQRAHEQAQRDIETERQQLITDRTEADQEKQRAEADVADAEKRVADANAERDRANAQKTRQMAYNDRKKKKADRLRQRVEAGEDVEWREIDAALR